MKVRLKVRRHFLQCSGGDVALWVRCNQVVCSTDCQCVYRNSPGFDLSIRRHSTVMLNTVQNKRKGPTGSIFRRKKSLIVSYETYDFPTVYQSKDKATELEFMLEQGRHLKSSYPKDGMMQRGLPLLLGIPQLR